MPEAADGLSSRMRGFTSHARAPPPTPPMRRHAAGAHGHHHKTSDPLKVAGDRPGSRTADRRGSGCGGTAAASAVSSAGSSPARAPPPPVATRRAVNPLSSSAASSACATPARSLRARYGGSPRVRCGQNTRLAGFFIRQPGLTESPCVCSPAPVCTCHTCTLVDAYKELRPFGFSGTAELGKQRSPRALLDAPQATDLDEAQLLQRLHSLSRARPQGQVPNLDLYNSSCLPSPWAHRSLR